MEVGGNQYFINEPGPEINKELERATEERNSLQIVDITSMFKPLETSQGDPQIIDTLGKGISL